VPDPEENSPEEAKSHLSTKSDTHILHSTTIRPLSSVAPPCVSTSPQENIKRAEGQDVDIFAEYVIIGSGPTAFSAAQTILHQDEKAQVRNIGEG
jgi:hypothetical protein